MRERAGVEFVPDGGGGPCLLRRASHTNIKPVIKPPI